MAFLLHHLLEESASERPDHDAIKFQDQSLTYGELDKHATQVAKTLRDAGVNPGDRVAIYVNKSIASIISIFGILKAGGVYVPFDPNAPVSRLSYISKNCGIEIVLTSGDKLNEVIEMQADGSPIAKALIINEEDQADDEEQAGLEVIQWSTILEQSPDNLTPPPTIETDLAYILYTSGSTGVPKGVMISHRTIFTFINWCSDTFQLQPEDRATSHAPLHFDLSTFDIFVTMKAGATLVLVPEKLSIFPIRLVKLFEEEKITVTYMVPSILSLMVNYGKLANFDLSSLRLVLFAGEVFPIKYLRKLVEQIPDPKYYNLYGPTETNVCTYYQVQPDDLLPERTDPVPIGIACENTDVFAVKDDGTLVERPGEEGELWVRGSCVAEGYWGDPEKTAQSFIANPFGTEFSELIYKTGDIVSLASDVKNFKFIGRKDHMIKSRGYRIELGEIESTLYSHQEVKEAAVVAVPDDLVGNRLLAYIVPTSGNGVTEKELKAHCGNHLPQYMLPEKIEFREDLPKTSTGKVDRQALLAQTSEV